MRKALLAAWGLGLLSVPFLGMHLTREGVLMSRPWAPLWVVAGVGALFLVGFILRVVPFISSHWFTWISDLLTSNRAGLLWLGIAVAVPFLPKEWMQTAAQKVPWLTLNTLTDLWLYVILALGLNLIVGQAGVLVLGYGGFYGIGAYAMALLAAGLPILDGEAQRYAGCLPYWWAVGLGIPAGALLAAAVGVLVGFPALRLKGDYLAIVTLGFGEALVLVLKNWVPVTGGTNGVSITPSMLKPLKGSWAYPSAEWHYGLALAAALLALLFHARLNRSRIGRALAAVREDETAARAMGIDAPRMKLLAFALAALWAGVAGALFAARIRFVTPESFTFLESVVILAMVVLGGMGSLRGVVLGAAAVTLLQEMLRGFGAYRMLVFGALLVVMMVFRPEGLMPDRRGRAS